MTPEPQPAAPSAVAPLGTLRRLTRVVTAVIALSLISLLGLVFYAGQAQHRQAMASVEQQLDGLLRLQTEQLTARVQDYAYWDEAIANILVLPDEAWWSSNAGDYALSSFGMTFTLALRGQGTPVFFSQAEGYQLDIEALGAQPAWQALMAQARAAAPAEGAHGVAGLVRLNNELFTVAAARLRPESEQSPVSPDPDALLVFAQSLDKALLPRSMQIIALDDWQRIEPGLPGQGLTLRLADGQPAGLVTWLLPERDGVVDTVLPWVGLLLLAMVAVLAQAGRRTALLAQAMSDEGQALALARKRAVEQAEQIQDAHERLRELHRQLQHQVQVTEEENRALADMALKDSLTQLGNRRSLQQAAQRLRDAARQSTRFAVLMIDIDHFKSINDQYGHDRGDNVLADVARCIQQAARQGDYAIRYGGEEFAVILDQASCQQATAVAERLHQQIRAARPAGLAVTVSIGVAMSADALDDLFKVINDADEALYLAKRQGRNRTVCAPGHDPGELPSAA